MAKRQLHLGVFLLRSGFHSAAWRHGSVPPRGSLDPGLYARVAKAAERGKFDALFVPDFHIEHLDRATERQDVLRFEPFTLLSYLAAVTERIGLVATASTTYDEVYHIARRFASLDHLSNGRAGWNVVTSARPAGSLFGSGKLPEHDRRYALADEFFRAVCEFWDVWEDDAILRDKEKALFYDRDRLHPVNFEGEHIRRKGVIDISRPPQGYPVIAQAGASEAGKAFGARYGEMIFVTGQPDMGKAQAFYADMKRRAEAHGRDRDDIRIMPAAHVFVAPTKAEAEEKFRYLQDLVHADIGLESLRELTGGYDFSVHDPDGPIPEVPLTNGNQTRQRAVFDIARGKGLTIRELYLELAGGTNRIVGTPAEVADVLETWFTNGAADGFMLPAQVLPDGIEDFVDLVVPELQSRGLFREEYKGSTLREHLGLKRPARGHFSRASDPTI